MSRERVGLHGVPPPFELPPDEAAALAQFVKRVDYGTCTRFANVTVTYHGRAEGDVMWAHLHEKAGQIEIASLFAVF